MSDLLWVPRRSIPGHSQFQLLVAVHAKHADRRPTDLGASDDVDAIPLEMFVPPLLAGVKEEHDRLGERVDPGEVGTFVEIAVNAGEAEVPLVAAATVLEWADMLDVKRGEWRVFLVELTILTAVSRPLPDERPEGGGHAALPDWNFFASRRSTATNLLART